MITGRIRDLAEVRPRVHPRRSLATALMSINPHTQRRD
jgi:hypothetical protein